MIKRISHTFMFVLDQDQALDFYVGKLGMQVHTDADLGNMRWLTVTPPGEPNVQLALMVPGPPAYDESTSEQVRELVSKGAAGGLIFETDDCRGTYEQLLAVGVEFTEAPVERFYGIDCALRDPFGNPIRITQPAEGPIEIPSPEQLASQPS
jgi:catechol 2,3-dioxygenase-like lactoylglutathione lyase family enzyme